MPTDKQRRAAERRRLQRQYQRRAGRAAARRRNTIIASVVGLIVVAGIVVAFVLTTGNEKSSPSAGASSPVATSPLPTPTSTAPRTPTYPCTWTASPNPAKKVSKPSTTTPARTGTVRVSVATTQGAMTFTLNRALAPCTVDSFVSLARQHYYDSTPCHRLTTAGIFVLQCGDPLGNGQGGPGYTIPDEATGNENYPAGTIAMARTGEAHSGGSQFFIVYKDSPNLRSNLGQLQYTVFGTVTKGMSVVQKVAAKGAPNGDGKPNLPITITSVAAG